MIAGHRERVVTISTCLIILAVALNACDAGWGQTTAVRWWEEYASSEARDPAVLGFWKFDKSPEEMIKDASSHQHKATLRGAQWSSQGRFGGCLESSAGYPIKDKSHGMHVARSAILSPPGAFTVEMWIKPKKEESQAKVRPVLLDSKYVAYDHQGFMLSLTKASGEGTRQLTLEIGTGSKSPRWYSQPFAIKAGRWRHVAFTYDAQGTVAFYVDGSELSRSYQAGAGPMAPSTRVLSIGDRIGSLYNGFPGFIDELRISSGIREFRPIRFAAEEQRIVLVRMSDSAKLRGEIINQSGQALKNAKVTATLPGGHHHSTALPDMAEGARHSLQFPIDSSLRPGVYQAKLSVDVAKWGGSEEEYRAHLEHEIVITPRPLPHRMPVVMWGVGGTDGVVKEIPRLKQLGFTHCLGLRVDYQRVWDQGENATSAAPEQILAGREMLNVALENDIKIVSSLSPARWLRTAAVGKPFQRVDRKGNHYGRHDVSGQFKPVREFCYNTGAAMGRAYGDHPAYDAALLHTEVRGESQVSFHPEEIAAYRAATGAEIPPQVTIKNGVQYQRLKGFPVQRVIPDDQPILQYLSWFWREGDRWNELNTQLHQGLKSNISRSSFWTFHDPACRVPSISGSGGASDVLSHWTYSYPDPVRIGLCTDELSEMARVSDRRQQVMKMTQLIWYRSQTAPTNASPSGSQSPWVDQDPDAAYITIAPMHLREAFWWKLARPIQGIMYHGWQSLVKTESPGAYRYTNPNTQHELKRLMHSVLKPLGPTLMQVPDAPSDVAFLESFTSQMFARRGTYGWNHTWAGDMYHILMYAQLQPRVMYEESLLKGELDDVKILVMADCDVLTESVVAKIRQFQARGGLVVGDAEVCPAIEPDLVISRFARSKRADEDRAKLIAAAAKLRTWLEGKYLHPLASSNPNVVSRRRRYGSTDYLFAVNDHREYGDYVGGYGLVMENGLPSQTSLTLRRKSGFVYDLTARRQLAAQQKGGALQTDLHLGPCQGRLLMVTERPIREVSVRAPKAAKRGEQATVTIAISDGQAPVDAVVPVRLRIVDPEGIEAEGSGFYGAASGQVKIQLDFAPNDRRGLWEIKATELASGLSGSAYLRLHLAH